LAPALSPSNSAPVQDVGHVLWFALDVLGSHSQALCFSQLFPFSGSLLQVASQHYKDLSIRGRKGRVKVFNSMNSFSQHKHFMDL